MVTISKKSPQKRENTYLCHMKRLFFSVCILLLLLSCQQAPEVIQQGDLSFVPMEAKRLPDMNTPRGGHALVWADNHILAVGGHTRQPQLSFYTAHGERQCLDYWSHI